MLCISLILKEYCIHQLYLAEEFPPLSLSDDLWFLIRVRNLLSSTLARIDYPNTESKSPNSQLLLFCNEKFYH